MNTPILNDIKEERQLGEAISFLTDECFPIFHQAINRMVAVRASASPATTAWSPRSLYLGVFYRLMTSANTDLDKLFELCDRNFNEGKKESLREVAEYAAEKILSVSLLNLNIPDSVAFIRLWKNEELLARRIRWKAIMESYFGIVPDRFYLNVLAGHPPHTEFTTFDRGQWRGYAKDLHEEVDELIAHMALIN